MKTNIYALFNPREPSTYFYIGQTSVRLSVRVSKHISGALGKTKDYNKEKRDWVLSLLKEGARPGIRLIEVCEKSIADDRERDYIEFFTDEGHPLLNIATGGLKGSKYSLSEEAREKQSLYSRNRTEEHKKNNRESFRGKKWTEEQKQRLSEAHLKGKKSHKVNKDIGQYDLEGNLLNRFKSTKEAVEKTQCSRGAIQGCIHKRMLTGYGYKWSFID